MICYVIVPNDISDQHTVYNDYSNPRLAQGLVPSHRNPCICFAQTIDPATSRWLNL